MMNMDSFQKVIDSLPNSAGRSSVEKVKSLVSSVVGVGITAMVVAMILLIPFCACSYVMGLQMLLETLGFCGSCVISLLGVIVIVVSVYFFVYIPITRMFSGLLLGIVVLGIFLLFLGVLGAVGYLIERKHKWPIRIFGVLLILILVAFFVLALIALQQAGSLRTTVTKGISSYCGLDGMADDEKNQNVIKASKCYEIVQSIVVYLCNGDENGILDPCPEKLKDDTQGECLCNTSLGDKVADFTKAEFFDTTVEYVVLVLEGNYKLVVLVGFLVVVLLVVMVVSVLASCCVYQKEPEGGKGGGGTSYVSDNGTGIGKGGAIGYVAYVNPTINNT